MRLYRACRRIHWRSFGPPFLSFPSASLLYGDFVPFVSVAPLAGQCPQIPHQFVEVEGQDRPWPRHLQRLPKTFFGFVEWVPVAFQRANASFGPTPLAAYLLPDCLGNRPRPLAFGLNPDIPHPFSRQPLARRGRIATAVVVHQLWRRLLAKDGPVTRQGFERHLPFVRIGRDAFAKEIATSQTADQIGQTKLRLVARFVAHDGTSLRNAHMHD